MGKEENLEEYATSKELNELDVAYLNKECFKSTYEIFNTPPDTRFWIKNKSYAGIIQLDNLRIQFSTKIQTNLFYMLSFLKDEKHFHYDPEKIIDIKEGEVFFDILGRLFLNELDAIFEKGFYKKYIRKEENIQFLKGKWLISKQFKNDIQHKPKFYCSYETLTYDNLENQIILRATSLLIPLIKFNDSIKRDLIRYSYQLREEVSLTNIVPEDCDRIQYSRLNEYYEAIIKFSKVVLQNYFIRTTTHGAAKGFNFIVNMNKVYEDFITSIIEEIINTDTDSQFQNFVVEKQQKFNSLDKNGEISIRPDVIIRNKDSGEYPLIIDAKYKIQENNVDYYQVIAYALAIPTVKAACLIYPETEMTHDSDLTLEPEKFGNQRGEIKLYSHHIDLFIDENDGLTFDEYKSKVKNNVREILTSILTTISN
jgi:5-methylcytosine-specific restriction enzyme subunit McrC